MQNVALQSQTSPILAQRRALWFVSILLALLVALAVGLTSLILHSARARIPVTLESELTPPMQHRASALAVWYTKLQEQTTLLLGTDMFRLFATEVNTLGPKAAELITREREEQTSPGDSDTVSRLASQMPLMRRPLQNLINRTDHVAITLITPSMYPYLSNAEPAPDASGALPPVAQNVRQAVQTCLDTGKSLRMPAYATPDKKLHMAMIYPIFAPAYIAASGSKAVGAAIFVCDVTSIVTEMTIARDSREPNQQGWLLQIAAEGLQRLLPDATLSAPLAGWQLNESGNLTIGLRRLPEGGSVYAQGIKLTDLPWLVVQDIRAEAVEATYAAYRLQVIFVVSACTLIAMLLIGMFWWWLVGRRERTVSNTLKQLYQTVNQQHELLRGINGTLADGIILNDVNGIVGYTNDAFAAMAGMKPDDMVGRAASAIFDKKLADRIFMHMEHVLKEKKSELYSEVLTLKSGRRHYQVACSPFHNESGIADGVVSVYRDVTDLVHAQEHAQTMLHQTVNVLVRAIEAIDPYLRGQSMQTGILAAHLAQGMRLGAVHANTVRSAANLSQIGMIQLPRDLVNKAGALTEQERTELQKHVEYARSSLEGIDFGLPVVDAIYQMHELLDGSGYPNRLQGKEIQIDARILAVANTFCALVRPRSYRQAHVVEKALEILSVTPPKYDPEVVRELRDFLQTANGEAFLRSLTTR